MILKSISLLLILLNILFTKDNNINNKYSGGWPAVEHIHSDDLPDASIDCPKETGCSCLKDDDCNNNNCVNMPRGKYCAPIVGEVFPNFIAIDQFGDKVNIYDFSKNNKYILIEMAAPWCSPCHELSNWITYNDQSIYNRRWFKEEYTIIRDLIINDKIYYITILFEDENRNNVTYETLYDWYQLYPDEKIPILADSDRFLHTWIKPTGLPTTLLLNDQMKIETFSTRGINSAFDNLLNILNNEK